MAHIMRIAAMSVFAVLAGNVAATAQTQRPSDNPRTYVRVNCVKVREGKGQEYSALLRDVALKLAKTRIDAPGSHTLAFNVAQAVAPAGPSARCDYQLVTAYTGFPTEPQTPEQLAADMKKAGIAMTREAFVAKRDELSSLVSTETWVYQASVGTPTKGGYIRINYDKVKPGMMQDWTRAQRDGWGPLAELAAKELGMSWRAATLVMPSGDALPYNAMTMDFFPSWDAVAKGVPTRSLWNKAHPNRDLTAHFDHQSSIRDRPRVDTLRLVEVIRK